MPTNFLRALVALVLLAPAFADAAVFINEIHYDDSDSPNMGDNNERVEVVATAGEDLSLYDIVLYNGSSPSAATTYDTDAVPTGSLVACGATVRIGTINYATNGLQNGANDGIALVLRSNSSVVQFLSYEGAATASNGPASGQTSTNLPVSESNSTAEGTSLQLGGSNGTTYSDFTWNGSATATFGTCNNSQTFAAGGDTPPTVSSSTPAHGATNVAIDTTFSITFSEQVDTTGTWFAFNCGAGTPTLTASASPATTFTLTASGPLPYSALCNLTVLASQVHDRDGTADAMAQNALIQFETVVDDPPSVVSTTPADLATDVSRSANLSVTFSEPVTAPATAFAVECPVGTTLPFQLSTENNTAFVLDPNADLPASTSCRLYVDNTQVTDLDGTPDNPARDTSNVFTTAAVAPPTIQSTVPVKNATNFPAAGDLQVVFDLSVTLGPGAFTLVCAQSTGISLTHASSGTSFVIGTGTVLVEGDSCTLTIEADAITSADGLHPDADEVVNFSVAATSAATYWQNVNLSSSAQLRCSIHQTIRNHTALTYTQAWEVLETGEEDPANPARVLDAYRNCSYLAGPTGDRVGGSGSGATCSGDPNERYNREHTWPNSLGFPDSSLAAYTDTHMLYATDEGYNASRGNKPYANCPSGCTEEPTDVNNGVGGGTGVYPGNSNWYDGSSYEVWNHRKGDVARAVMYMAMRYEGGDNLPDLELTDTRALIVGRPATDPIAYMGLLTTLLQWNTFDAPDQREQDRNAIVQTYQGNRNPFIDHPEWATAGLFGSAQPATCTLNTSAPAANDDNYATPVDTQLLVAANAGVLINDNDAEGAPLSAQLATGATSGTLALVANGGFTYAPASAFCGNASFTYRASDGVRLSTPRTVTIAVGSNCGANQAPSFSSSPVITATEDQAYNYSVTATDANGDTMTLTAPTKPAWLTLTPAGNGTAALSGTPTNAEVGTHNVTLRVSDGVAAPVDQSFVITVSNSNDAPTFTSSPVTTATEDTAYNDSITTSDVDAGAALTLTAPTLPGWLTFTPGVNGAGTLSGTPTNAHVGTHNVTLRVSDGIAAPVDQVFTITVSNVNDAPTFTSSPVASASEDAAYNYSITAGDVDAGAALTLTAPTLPSWLTFTPGANGAGSLSGTPTNAQVGTHNVTLRVSDGIASPVDQVFTIAVSNTNDAPTVAQALANRSAQEGVAIAIFSVSIGFADVDAGDDLDFSANALPAGLMLNAETGEISGTPAAGSAAGSVYAVTITATDTGDATVQQSFSYTVTPVTPSAPHVFGNGFE